jgi:hypothetical protein
VHPVRLDIRVREESYGFCSFFLLKTSAATIAVDIAMTKAVTVVSSGIVGEGVEGVELGLWMGVSVGVGLFDGVGEGEGETAGASIIMSAHSPGEFPLASAGNWSSIPVFESLR